MNIWGKITNINKYRKKRSSQNKVPKKTYKKEVYTAALYEDGGYYSLGQAKSEQAAKKLIDAYVDKRPGMKNKTYRIFDSETAKKNGI